MWYLLAFAAGAIAEYYSERWGVRYANAVTGKYRGLTADAIRVKVWEARKWGVLLFLLSQVDLGALLGGWKLYLSVVVGAALGGWIGLGDVMMSRWERRNPEEEDE